MKFCDHVLDNESDNIYIYMNHNGLCLRCTQQYHHFIFHIHIFTFITTNKNVISASKVLGISMASGHPTLDELWNQRRSKVLGLGASTWPWPPDRRGVVGELVEGSKQQRMVVRRDGDIK
jgi:hypothetical protein